MRGVATCHWRSDFRSVFIPRAWMKHVKVLDFKYTHSSASSTIEGTPMIDCIKDGDYAMLGRCPSLSNHSIQAVRVYGWNNGSIGVHPNMCDPTNWTSTEMKYTYQW